MSEVVEVGLVQINEGMTWSRQRWRRCRIVKGSVVSNAAGAWAPGDSEPEPDEYAIFPYSVGILQAYAEATHPARFQFRPAIYRRLPVQHAVDKLRGVHVAAFSTYVWNVNLSLAIAARLKHEEPSALVVFGGPQVPDRPEALLRQHRAIDIACHGEGERTFAAILDRAGDRDFAAIPGISYLDPDGTFRQNPKAPRIQDLSEVPSPYLSGVFDPLLAAQPRERWILLWETNRGCPYSCTFCDWGSAVSSRIYRFDTDRLLAELEWFGERCGEVIFCCDANFGILPRDLDLARHAAAVKERLGYPRALSVQNSKNATDRTYQIQKLLSDAEMNPAITLSMQSVNPPTLDLIRRKNISLDHFERLQAAYTRDGAETYTDIILGLPGETYDSFADGLDRIIDGGQHNRILFYNLSLLPNAEMGDPAYQERHGLVSVDQRILNAHSSRKAVVEVPEYLRIVVASSTMPAAAWIRAKSLWWMTDFLYFGRLLQIPFIVLHHMSGMAYRRMFEAFLDADDDLPVTRAVCEQFVDQAERIQRGGLEYIPDDGWLDLYWPTDQFALISIVAAGKLDGFYAEAQKVLAHLAAAGDVPQEPVLEALALNRELLRVPGRCGDSRLTLEHNVWQIYRSVLFGKPVELEARRSIHHIDRAGVAWSDLATWCEHVIWCTNRKNSYFHAHHELAHSGAEAS